MLVKSQCSDFVAHVALVKPSSPQHYKKVHRIIDALIPKRVGHTSLFIMVQI
jgi:hypothetical protein